MNLECGWAKVNNGEHNFKYWDKCLICKEEK